MDVATWRTTDGRTVPHVDLGGDGGVQIVAVPGLTDGLAPLSDPAVVDQLARLPRDDDLHLRMLGHPDPLPDHVTTRWLADSVAAWLEVHTETPVVLIGHSLGGMVAQWVAADHPSRIAALVLTATGARLAPAAAAHLETWCELLRQDRTDEQAVAALRVSFTGSSLLRRLAAHRVLGSIEVDAGRIDRHLALTHAALTHDARAALEGVSVPTVVLGGELDPLFPPDEIHALADALGGRTRVEVLPGVAHGFPEQARPAVRHHVVTLAARISLHGVRELTPLGGET